MTLMQMSISAGLLIAAIAIVRAIGLNKLPKGTFIALWAVAIFRLIIPVSLPWFSADQTQMPQIFTPVGDFFSNFIFIPNANAMQPIRQAPDIPWVTIIWLFGMVVLMTFFVICWAKSHNRLRFATTIRGNEFLDDWLVQHRLMRRITILQSNEITTPIAVGFFRPRIILPKTMDLTDTQTLYHVLMHEYFHIKRFDILWKVVLVVVACIHWFNPMVWVMLVLANRDLELTCDEMVIRRLFGGHKTICTKAAYATSIINMAESRSKINTLIYSGFSKNATAERIGAIMKIKRKTIIGTLVAMVLVVGLTIGTLSVFANDNRVGMPTRCTEDCEPAHTTQINLLRGHGRQQMRRQQGFNNMPRIIDLDIMDLDDFLAHLEDDFLAHLELVRFELCRMELDIRELRCGSRVFDINLSQARNNGMRMFNSLDELLEYFGASYADFVPIETPVYRHITDWSELLIWWNGELLNVLEDAEFYEMARNGATLRDIVAVLNAR